MNAITNSEEMPSTRLNHNKYIMTPKPNQPECDWEQNEEGWWDTDCNNAFEFAHGNPSYNEFKFCPYCGKTITETPYDDEKH